jgi:TIR domain
MPTSREYFESEIPGTFSLDNELTLAGSADQVWKVPLRHYIDFESRSRHIAVYIPQEVPHAAFLLSLPHCKQEVLKCAPGRIGISSTRVVGAVGQALKVTHKEDGLVSLQFSADGLVELDLNELPFSGRVMVYSAGEIAPHEKDSLVRTLAPAGFFPWFRGAAFAAAQTLHSHPVAFVSHDSRDKADIVRPLVARLQEMMLPVWYDEFSLSVGDSLRSSIEAGLKACPKCILVLTPQFLAKGGWPKREYDSVFTRELVEDANVILPIWCGVSRDQVYEYSPILADKVGSQWDRGLEQVAKDLFKVLKPYASAYAAEDVLQDRA